MILRFICYEFLSKKIVFYSRPEIKKRNIEINQVRYHELIGQYFIIINNSLIN